MSANPKNYELDFSGKLPVSAQIGMEQAYSNADEFWKAILSHCIWQAARRLAKLTVDDVLDELDAVNVERKQSGKPLISTHNLSALGPCMRRAAKEKIIRATTERQRSQREVKHGNLHTVWQSNFAPEVKPSGGKP